MVWRLLCSSAAAALLASTAQTAPPLLAAGAAAGSPAFVLQSKPLRMEPFRESRLQLNPPTFRWPVEKGAAATYRIELARDRKFTSPRVELVHDLWFRPLEPLATGTWYWRCRVETPHPGAWLGPESFELTADLPTWSVPPWSELVARIPSTHPRVYVRREGLPALRANARRLVERLQPRENAITQALAEPFTLERYEQRVAKLAGSTTEEIMARRVAIMESKAAAMAATDPAADGAWLWVATGNLALLDAVKRRALLAARFDPHGFISERSSGSDSANIDFGNALLVHHLGVIYDLLYAELTADERRLIRAAIVARAAPIFAKVQRCSQELMRAHAWQHGFLDALVGALAMVEEEPVATGWVESGLKAFVAFYPWFGGNDGGSQEGTRYFHGQEMIASLNTLDVFRSSFGLRLEEGNPWFRANPYFLIYSFPPGGAMARLGDKNGVEIRDGDDLQVPNGKSRLAALHMAELHGNGHAAAYAAALPESTPQDGSGFGLSEILRWSGAPATKPVALATLPAARLFADIGAVYTHSALTRPEDNVRLVFHASPYGGHGHAHADQNSFHVIAYGEDLLLDSGYYPAFNNADPHRLKWSVQTKAHNSILVDGCGQSWGDTRGYGRIAHFESHDDWVYLVGSAEHAYPDAPLTRFDRHIVWLRGESVQSYVIVDDLAAAGGMHRRFDWLLHATQRMAVDEPARRIQVRGEKGGATITLLAPAALAFQQDDRFDVPAMSWQDGITSPLPNQWHLKATPPPTTEVRFVAVVQVGKPGVARSATRFTNGVIETGGWRMTLPGIGERLSILRIP